MKKYIFPNLIFSIEGRIFMYIGVLGTLLFAYATIFHFTEVGFLGLALTVVFIFCLIYLFYELGENIFGVLKITDEYVQYNFSFIPIVRIRFDEIEYLDIRVFDKGNKYYNPNYTYVDLYKWMIISTSAVPRIQLNKMKNSRKKQIIKFPVNKRLCEAIADKLSQPQKGVVERQMYLYKKSN